MKQPEKQHQGKGFINQGFLLLSLFSFLPFFLFSQEGPAVQGLEPDAISLEEQYVLSRVPLLELPEAYKGPDAPLLPSWVDNSTQPYFRSITTQSGYECGQSAGIAFNFTYEIDRLRGVSANNNDHLYPTHFAWDFLNSGDNYTGASFFDSWEIVRACGTMNVTDYGGSLNAGGYTRWITGYDSYYNGMQNRVTSVKAIRVDNPEGLQTLKYWLFDHLEGSLVGGVGNIYGKYFGSVATTLPSGTPEAGKFVQTYWGPSPSHAWTICGYNDSIRWDYNNDGQYTNNIDITGDGVVDMHDWEIGGLKFANGYAGTGWCDQGFCYLMYKTLADDIGFGGIWNHTVYVIDVKESCEPQLTMKVKLKHPSRNKIRVRIGMSTSLSATEPDHELTIPVFQFQGGDYYLQGGTLEEHKILEFGLDLTPLLSELTSNTTAKYFLMVDENDPGNTYPGEIISWSLIDYTDASPQTIAYPTNNVPLTNNGTTTLSVNHNVTFSKPVITTTSLPTALLYQPYTTTLNAGYGDPPYLWDADLSYPETLSAATFQNIDNQFLTPTNNNTGYAIQVLPFPFPFYDRMIDTLYIYADGYILFDDQPYTYPYLIDHNLLFRQTAILAPFMTDLRLYYNGGDGLWYEGDGSSATIRWKASINNLSGSTSLNFSVKFFPDGKIEYNYGTMTYPGNTEWTGGLAAGDNRNFQYSQLHGDASITANTVDVFTSCGYPVEMEISEDGVFSGTPQYPYFNQPITFRVTDNNGISNTKTLNFTTHGLLVQYSLDAGGDTLIEFGETVAITMSLTNLGNNPYTGVETWITEQDPYMVLSDSTEYVGTINPGQTVTFPDAFAIEVSPLVPNQYGFSLVFHEISNQQNFEKTLNLTAWAPDVEIGMITLDDGDNGQLDPGETTDILVSIENHGGAKVHNLSLNLTAGDPYVLINQGSGTIPLLHPDSTVETTFNISASPQAPFEHFYLVNLALTGSSGFVEEDSLWLFSGNIVEDFESGTTLQYPWLLGGDGPWYINDFEPYEGTYDLRSGWIFDDMESHMILSVNVLQSGTIKFWKRVSCEDDPNGANYDYLSFSIDDVEMGRWDGAIPWEEVSYPVSTGYHTFKWVYHKDYSVSAFYDCCWLDYITLPPFENALPEITVTPDAVSLALDPGQTGTETLTVENTGNGMLFYTVQVYDSTNLDMMVPETAEGSSISCLTNSFIQGETFSWTMSLHNGSTDGENIKRVTMDFPAGVTVEGATNFSGGSLGDLEYDGTTGMAPTLTWYGDNGGTGVVKPDETATAVITGSIEAGMTFDVFIVYVIEGDGHGSDPHQIAGEIRIANEGVGNEWLSLSSATGGLLPGFFNDLTLEFDATDLSSGDYTCDLLVRDPYNNMQIVPVFLHVNWPLTIPEPGSAKADQLHIWPNPCSGSAQIRFQTKERQKFFPTIHDMVGKQIKVLTGESVSGKDLLWEWDGTDDAGREISPGIYFVRVKTSNGEMIRKLIKIQ